MNCPHCGKTINVGTLLGSVSTPAKDGGAAAAEISKLSPGDSLSMELHHGGGMQVPGPEDASVPQDVLGVYYSPSKEQAASHGPVITEHVELARVFPVSADDVPRTAREAVQWREDLKSDGYDGVVIRPAGAGDLPEVIKLQ